MCFIYVYHHIIYVFCIHVWCSAAVSQRFRWIGNLCFFFSLSLDRNYRKAERNFAINTHNNSFSHEICLKQRTHTATQTHIHTHICNMHTQYCVWYMWEYIAIQPSSPKIFQCPLLVLSPSCFPGFSWFIFFFRLGLLLSALCVYILVCFYFIICDVHKFEVSQPSILFGADNCWIFSVVFTHTIARTYSVNV